MAKMFYTMDETKSALGRNEEEVKQLVREGRLREFRDGPRLMFKADQVDQIKAELAGRPVGIDQVDLGPSDSGAPIGLVESKGASGASGTSITLSETDAGDMPKEDTALSADLGLSGSLGGTKDRSHGSVINVFGTEADEVVDPHAQTAMSAQQEQINLESVGSGSGLLDLTRESDDTSLGSELLDEIAPGRAGESEFGTAAGLGGIEEPRGGVTRGVGAPVFVEAADSMAPAFGAAALGTAIVLLIAAFAFIAALNGVRPDFVQAIGQYSLLVLSVIGLVVVGIFFIVGLVIGRTSQR